MIRLHTNLNQFHTHSLLNYTLVDKDALSDIVIIEDDFSYVKRLKQKMPDCYIIFIGSHYHYLNDALSLNIDSYLLKPLTQESLDIELIKFKHSFSKRNKKCILLTTTDKLILSSDELIYFSSSYKQLKIVTKKNTYYSHVNNKKTLLKLIDTLDFISVSKSLYINKNEILSSGHDSYLLSNGEKVFKVS